MIKTIGLALAASAIGASLGLTPHINPAHEVLADAPHVCMEDQPCWSCVDDGNRVCGPGNSNHAPAGCYDDGGVLWANWPCEAWKPSDGYRHGDGSVTCGDGFLTEVQPDGRIVCVVNIAPLDEPDVALTARHHSSHRGSHHKSTHHHRTQLASGPNAYDDGAYVGGYN